MCGGAGTRVWPESLETLPKQFIPLVGERSTLQTTMACSWIRLSRPRSSSPMSIIVSSPPISFARSVRGPTLFWSPPAAIRVRRLRSPRDSRRGAVARYDRCGSRGRPCGHDRAGLVALCKKRRGGGGRGLYPPRGF
ncbi:hypothetical protein [Methylocystis iwaonis]|uniref:hypothetical protein n=1 Tax=Methylocystis iwaonis TaxID=2885079 RepID=UPI002490D8D5|nr:hypothetical protein [Methylocystis iwaonis]